jgi:hypothetical protein
MYPGDFSHFYSGPGSVGAMMNMSWSLAPDVFLVHHGVSPTPAGETFLNASWIGISETVTWTGAFDVDFTIDGAGLASISLPALDYTILWGSLGFVSFDADVAYDSATLGHLGDRVLHFHPAAGSMGVLEVVGPSGLILPALPANDTLTISGTFELDVDRVIGAGSTVKVFGVASTPEPGTGLISILALTALGAYARRRLRSSSRPSRRSPA